MHGHELAATLCLDVLNRCRASPQLPGASMLFHEAPLVLDMCPEARHNGIFQEAKACWATVSNGSCFSSQLASIDGNDHCEADNSGTGTSTTPDGLESKRPQSTYCTVHHKHSAPGAWKWKEAGKRLG